MTESKGAPVSTTLLTPCRFQQIDPQPPERKTWDKSEWEAKAKEKDQRYQDRAKAADDSLKQGQF